MFREVLVYTGTGTNARKMSEYAGQFAAAVKARLTGLVVEVDYIDYSEIEKAMTNPERMSAIDALIKKRNETHDAMLRIGTQFEEIARRHGVQHRLRYEACVPADIADIAAEYARVHDCTLLPSTDDDIDRLQNQINEAVLFGSGRPLIVVPTDRNAKFSIENVVVAWDGSRPATRAVHDALPILQIAASVRIVTITEEKPLDRLPTGQDLVRHLIAHGITARQEEARFSGASAGKQIMEEALQRSAGLLVMGAYGHSRVRQIVFGGATRTILNSPRLPVLLSY